MILSVSSHRKSSSQTFTILKQRPKLKWAASGDGNSNLYHAAIKKRARNDGCCKGPTLRHWVTMNVTKPLKRVLMIEHDGEDESLYLQCEKLIYFFNAVVL